MGAGSGCSGTVDMLSLLRQRLRAGVIVVMAYRREVARGNGDPAQQSQHTSESLPEPRGTRSVLEVLRDLDDWRRRPALEALKMVKSTASISIS